MDERRLELLEAAVWCQIQHQVAPAFRDRFGVSVRSDQLGVRIRASRTGDLSLNRVYALGVSTPLTTGDLHALVEEYTDSGAPRFLISWAPVAAPTEARGWFEARGFRRIRPIARLTRHTSPDFFVETDLAVREASASDAKVFGEIAARGNGLSVDFADGFNSTIGSPGWRHYLVLDGERPVSAAALFVDGDYAWAGLAGTLPDDRRRGSQSALLARQRLGFDITYELENFVLDVRTR